MVAISKGMWAVKLCTNKILLFLTGGAGYWPTQVDLHNGCKTVCVCVCCSASVHPIDGARGIMVLGCPFAVCAYMQLG